MTSEFMIDASEVVAFAAAMGIAPDDLQRELKVSAEVVLHEGIGYARENAPKDNGDLAASIVVLDGPSADGGSYGSSLEYAWMREEGGVIRARNAKALAFMYNGHLVMVQSVYQEGTKYMERSADTMEPRIVPIYELAIDRVMGRI